ncbi:MAG TPA: hypothetical protein VN256_13700 [Pyrinomonadaceae bacterium]|nr:hypothetical protein [Pyrinomonadaceae bacterium]
MKNIKPARIIRLSFFFLVLLLAGSPASTAQLTTNHVDGFRPEDVPTSDDTLSTWNEKRAKRIKERLEAPGQGDSQPRAAGQTFWEAAWPNLAAGLSEADREIPLLFYYNSLVYRMFIAPGRFLLAPLGVTPTNFVGMILVVVLAAFVWTVALRLLWRIMRRALRRPPDSSFAEWLRHLWVRAKLLWGRLTERLKDEALKHTRLVYFIVASQALGLILVGLAQIEALPGREFIGTAGGVMLVPSIIVLLIFAAAYSIVIGLYLITAVSVYYPLAFVRTQFNLIRDAYGTARKIMARDFDSNISNKWSPKMAAVVILMIGYFTFMFFTEGVRSPSDAGFRLIGFCLLAFYPWALALLRDVLYWPLVLLLLPFTTLGRPFFKEEKEAPAKVSLDDEVVKLPVPDGVTFGDQVLVMPAINTVFERAVTHWWRPLQNGTWVNRGDTLSYCSVKKENASVLERFLARDWMRIPLRSPASGLILKGTDCFDQAWAAILLPENEPRPEPPEYVFGELCDFFYEHRAYIFRNVKKAQASAARTDEELKGLFDEQRAASYDTASARTTYGQDIKWFSEGDDELRPRLVHLMEPAAS